MNMHRLLALTPVLVLVGFALACNGDDGGGTPTSSPAATATPRATATAAAQTASATPAATASSGAGEIAYISQQEGDIWLINADGSGGRRLLQGQFRYGSGPSWSPRGDKIACAGGGTTEAPTKIIVVDLEGRILAEAEHEAWRGGFAWSADDRHFVYTIAEGEAQQPAGVSLVIGDAESEATVRLEDAQDARWSPDGAQLAYLKTAGEEPAIYDVASGQTRPLAQGLRPLAWALGGKALLVVANYQEQEFGADYEAYLMDLASDQMTRVPELDNSTQFWLSRDGGAAAFLAGPAERAEGGVTISVLDLTSGGVTPIEGAVIGYPSEGIPPDHVAFSPDGAYLYWIDVVATSEEDLSGTIYRARIDGSELTQLAAVEGVLFALSPDRTRMVYSVAGALGVAALWVAAIDGGDARPVGEVMEGRWPPAAWRPLP